MKNIYLFLILLIFVVDRFSSTKVTNNVEVNVTANDDNEKVIKKEIPTQQKQQQLLEPIVVGKHGLNDTLYWGTYKPHTYFSMKTRSTQPINTGLLWSTPNVNNRYERFVYKCNQGSDGIENYEWTKHDGKLFGIQNIHDKTGNLNITTSFIKHPGPKGGDWSVRISGRSDSFFDSPIVSLVYYIQDESIQKSTKDIGLNIKGLQSGGGSVQQKKGLEGDVQVTGTHPEIGEYTLYFSDVPESAHPKGTFLKTQPSTSKWHYYGISKFDQDNWDPLPQIFDKVTNTHLQTSFNEWAKLRSQPSKSQPIPPFLPTLPNKFSNNTNLVAIQRLLKVPFDIEISFVSHDYHVLKDGEVLTEERLEKTVKEMTGSYFSSTLDKYQSQFNQTFFDRFFATTSQQDVHKQISRKILYKESYRMSMSSLSNIMGGIGFWHGSGQIKTDAKQLVAKKGPMVSLFSATPSRPAFPRGFLWDEGFHQLVISSFDVSLTVECLSYWLNLMDENGWIPREQILGREAMSMVPKEFQVQSSEIANPPALILAVNKLVDIVESAQQQHLYGSTSKEVELIQEFLKDAYPRLEKLYKFYWKTQDSVVKNMFRWRGRVVNHTLSSGLDDYPRCYPNQSEIHIDLTSWVAFYAGSMARISQTLGKDHSRYQLEKQTIVSLIEKYLWDDETSLYQDIVYRGDSEPPRFFRTHGYINYFPLILGLIPEDSPRLSLLIETLKDTQGIWSRFGILSLSKKDPYYGTGENYWKGPIWFNINYLFTHSMYKKYIQSGPLKENIYDVYTTLRQNLLVNVLKNYKETGFLWEQYDPEDGVGRRNHPFNGWTSLIVLVISEHY
ncbi:glycoside hydrolase family 63 protein [Tieghemostelium lacteum]|uniref:Mannosyl-oligosaccharide glucosidase n=1 Tax=Tieghemostelium lacteum TaxID=361077 RepID=A0A151ZIB9_TIELA|nr:glycoside hydrolase family 63 protein [Tieghemostelium lacteum]|eukprot:KYQ93594.1 glycoside hydrolase family 63 protein [Tieghemostelium lacteum]